MWVLLDPNAPSGMTLDAMRLRLAQEVGLAVMVTADGQPCDAALPSGPTLAKIDRAVQEAVSSFMLADPFWSFLNQTLSLQLDPAGTGPDNIARDPGRYRLPNALRGGPQSWVLTQVESGTAVWNVKDSTVAAVLAAQQTGTITGVPYLAAIRPIANPEEVLGGAAWEVLVGPKPSKAFVLTGTFSINWQWTDGAERHIFGAEHDQTLYLMAVAAFRRADGQTGPQAQLNQTLADRSLAQSIRMDKERRPKNLGRVVSTTGAVPSVRLPGGFRARSGVVGIVDL